MFQGLKGKGDRPQPSAVVLVIKNALFSTLKGEPDEMGAIEERHLWLEVVADQRKSPKVCDGQADRDTIVHGYSCR